MTPLFRYQVFTKVQWSYRTHFLSLRRLGRPAAPHPPRHPSRQSHKPKLSELKNPKRVSAWGSFFLRRVRLFPPQRRQRALQHGKPLPGQAIRAAWDLDAGRVRVSVSDGGGATEPELGEPTPTTIGGRGLRIVARLSRHWGTSSGHEGTTVWAEVQLGPQPAVAVPAAAAESSLATPAPAGQRTLSVRST